jgi:hypothetical protein
MTDKEAMKLALFALDIVKIHFTQSRHVNEAIAALKERLAQPEQEPVIDKSAATRIATSLGWSPQRKWLGLSPNELNMISDSMKTWNSFQITDVYFAIEAKLKEKNT